MIVEDENGNDVDLNDLDEREPDEPDHDEPQPVDLAEVRELLDQAENATFVDQQREAERRLLCEITPALVGEIEALREQLAYWRSLPTREEYATAVGGDGHPDKCIQVWHASDADEALAMAANLAQGAGGRAWTRGVSLHPWTELAAESPF